MGRGREGIVSCVGREGIVSCGGREGIVSCGEREGGDRSDSKLWGEGGSGQ